MSRIWGILSLVVVLAAMAFVARKQLPPPAPAANVPGQAGSATVPGPARSMQDLARDETVRALQQGADRNQRADQP